MGVIRLWNISKWARREPIPLRRFKKFQFLNKENLKVISKNFNSHKLIMFIFNCDFSTCLTSQYFLTNNL